MRDARLGLKSSWCFVHTCRPTSCIRWLQDSTYRRPGQSIARDSSGSPDWRRQDSRACPSACRCPRHPTTRRPLASPASARSCQNTQLIFRYCWKHENHETLGEINMDKPFLYYETLRYIIVVNNYEMCEHQWWLNLSSSGIDEQKNWETYIER